MRIDTAAATTLDNGVKDGAALVGINITETAMFFFQERSAEGSFLTRLLSS